MYPVRPDWSVSFVPSRVMDRPPLQVTIEVLPLLEADGAAEVADDTAAADEVAAMDWPLFCLKNVGPALV